MEVNSTDKPTAYYDQLMEQPALMSFLRGTASVFSTRSPTKETCNEDAAAIVPFDEKSGVIIVADGMGGHANGEVASKLAIQRLISAIKKARDTQSLLRTGIITGFEKANQAVLDLGTGSGTTLSVVEIGDGHARTYHAGDSITIICSLRGKLKLETVSHSLVGLGVESGLLDEKEAAAHEDRHLILNAIGSVDMRIDIGSPIKLAKRDTIIIASDGLSDNLSTADVVAISRCGPLVTASSKLATKCQQKMVGDAENAKPDDLTFICFRPTACLRSERTIAKAG
jgi:protein phosphatase